ncbi:MAG: DUF2846 domain-containing protein [Hydrogenophilales bacterium]|nr:DUF2846 domain-containing protein [Hydrogenophilales bacterium]
MKLFTRSALVILSLALLAGCATGAKFAKQSPPPHETLIYIYRPSQLLGSAQRPDVKINFERIGSLVSGGYLAKRIYPGHHFIVLTGNGNPFTWNYPDWSTTVEAAAGTVHYFRYKSSVKMGAFGTAHTYSFEAIPEETALLEIAELNQIE